jgi:hypothetical protein
LPTPWKIPIALSTVEAEYVSADSCCAQLLWMKQTLLDYGVKFDCIPLLCDNESAIKIVTNLVQHKRTKHIDIRHHFLSDHVGKGDIVMEGVRIDDQLANIFTKPLDETRFCKLRSELNVVDLSNVASNLVILILYLYHTFISLNCMMLISCSYAFLFI